MHAGRLRGSGALDQPSEVELSLPVDGECNVVTHDGCNLMRADFLLASCCRDCRARALRWGATREAQTNTEYSRRNNLHAKAYDMPCFSPASIPAKLLMRMMRGGPAFQAVSSPVGLTCRPTTKLKINPRLRTKQMGS